MKNNKIIGNEFEKEFALYLQERGMFVYNLPNKYTGQPFDIIAVKNNVFYAFECKHCNNNYFRLDRVEDNQIQVLRKLNKASTSNYYFVFKFDDCIRFCHIDYIENCIKISRKNIKKEELKDIGVLLNEIKALEMIL